VVFDYVMQFKNPASVISEAQALLEVAVEEGRVKLSAEPVSGDPLEHQALLLMRRREALAHQLRNLADKRPPVTFNEVAQDREFIREAGRYRDAYETIDVSMLEDENGRQDPEHWTLIAFGDAHERYQVRETSDPEYTDDPDEPVWIVVDSEDGDSHVDTFYDESDAENDAETMNRDDLMANLHGFPFAQNIGYVISLGQAARFAAAGFLVWEHEPSGKVIAGIDGGGYAMIVHWQRLAYASWTVIETETGPRRTRE
jgi:hypothetical protein